MEICMLNARIVLLEKGNASILPSNERILLAEKENEILNEKVVIVKKENNVLVNNNNEVLEIIERKKENWHTLCVRESDTSKNLKDIQNHIDLILKI